MNTDARALPGANVSAAGVPMTMGDDRSARDWLPWVVYAAGFLCLLVPTLVTLFTGIWRSDEQAHGPIVLAVGSWLIYRRWQQVYDPAGSRPAPGSASVLVLVAGFVYAVGRSQGILIFEVGALLLLLVASVGLFRGWARLGVVWFGLFFLLFAIPLPGPFVDAVTAPMKMAVSYMAEHILYAAGYPIARTGVMLQIGPYQLLVADACAGLHTLFTLEALGLLYLNMVRYASLVRNVGLAILIVPISFFANVIRVVVLTLVTYYLGDEAGQGFLHGAAGMVLFLSALALIVAADSVLRWFSGRWSRPTPQGASA